MYNRMNKCCGNQILFWSPFEEVHMGGLFASLQGHRSLASLFASPAPLSQSISNHHSSELGAGCGSTDVIRCRPGKCETGHAYIYKASRHERSALVSQREATASHGASN
ncbi:hypothetical protein ILYODFUR_009917 [Ilyodon furcidens]|uniref:Uncharacterized protein n=1 Tax=Ilyodon furcidens TaxID=33524 RepID=A0ABV0V4N7_9TELE